MLFPSPTSMIEVLFLLFSSFIFVHSLLLFSSSGSKQWMPKITLFGPFSNGYRILAREKRGKLLRGGMCSKRERGRERESFEREGWQTMLRDANTFADPIRMPFLFFFSLSGEESSSSSLLTKKCDRWWWEEKKLGNERNGMVKRKRVTWELTSDFLPSSHFHSSPSSFFSLSLFLILFSLSLFLILFSLSLPLPFCNILMEVFPSRLVFPWQNVTLFYSLWQFLPFPFLPWLDKMAFREAHEVTGRVVAKAEQLGCDLSQVPLQQLRSIRYHSPVLSLSPSISSHFLSDLFLPLS